MIYLTPKTAHIMEGNMIALLVVFMLVSVNDAADKRNVLLMVADDEGRESPIYGNDKIKTPNLQALADRSLLFDNAYTSVSSCSPSRSVIMTGLPQHQNGMYGLEHATHHFRSFDDVMSLPRILNKTGDYWTGIIGKKHVAPESVFPYAYSFTEQDGYSLNQVGRNITLMKQLARNFLAEAKRQDNPFFLYVGFFDAHRGCGVTFCEDFGDGSKGNGVIPDWKPVEYDPDDVYIPYFIQDTPTARKDIAAQYKTISRLDQGVGLMVQALKDYGFDNNTLILYVADNGCPFPNAKTNLYESGMIEPMMISNPQSTKRWGQKSTSLVSTTNIVPTVLDWFGLKYPDYKLFGPHKPTLQSDSLLPLTESEPDSGWDTVYASHDFHEITNYYPMRVIRTKQYRLIKNLNFKMPYPMATDLYQAPTFQDILNNSIHNHTTKWFKTLDEYYFREQYELYDIVNDPHELKNIIDDPKHASALEDLQTKLHQWRDATDDPWICWPQGVYLGGETCHTLNNGI